MTPPNFMDVYRHPAPVVIKASIIAWSDRCMPWDGTEIALFVAQLNDLLQPRTPLTVDGIIPVLQELERMNSIDIGVYQFDTHCKSPDRADEEARARDGIDDTINALIRGLL